MIYFILKICAIDFLFRRLYERFYSYFFLDYEDQTIKLLLKNLLRKKYKKTKYTGAGGSDRTLPTSMPCCIYQKMWIYNFFLFPRTIFLHIIPVLLLKTNYVCWHFSNLNLPTIIFYFSIFEEMFLKKLFPKVKKIPASWTPPFTIIADFW